MTMKKYFFQLQQGAVFCTEQQVVFTRDGYAIDKQAVTDEESNLCGQLQLTSSNAVKNVSNMEFKASVIIASWEE
jgi:hypothetical protein